MSRKALQRYLDIFRGEEDKSVLYLLSDRILCTGIIVWPKVRIEFMDESTWPDPPNDLGALWSWCWQRVKFEPSEFFELAGVDGDSGLLLRLKSLHLIYPDGTTHKEMFNCVMAEVAANVGKLTRAMPVKKEKQDG